MHGAHSSTAIAGAIASARTFGRIAVSIAGVVAVAMLIFSACRAPLRPMPPPDVSYAKPPSPIKPASHPWDLTPPNRPLPLITGISPGVTGAETLQSLREGLQAQTTENFLRFVALFWETMKNQSEPVELRAQAFLNLALPTCAVGKFGLPPTDENRALFARMFVRYVDEVSPDIGAFRQPWHFRILDAATFKRLPPEAIESWTRELRVPALPTWMGGGAVIVLFGAPPPEGRWMLCTVWTPDRRSIIAIHVLPTGLPRRPANGAADASPSDAPPTPSDS